MRTVRRLYFYALSLIGAEAVVWGTVTLLRTVLSKGLVGVGGQLATGLSALLVGLPVFLLHWRTCARDAREDSEEANSRVRAVFLYAIRAAFLVPMVYSSLALLDRWAAALLGAPEAGAAFGGSQSASDNLVALAVLAGAFAFFSRVLAEDLRAAGPASFLPETRRLYRFIWVVFGLTMTVAGVQSLLRYLLSLPAGMGDPSPYLLANGLALVIVGTPLWAWTWRLVGGALDQPGERSSVLRLVVLYMISLAGLVGVLASGGNLLSQLLSWAFGRPLSLSTFLVESGGYIGAGIPLGVVWVYHNRVLESEMLGMGDPSRREAVQRLYRSILSALGVIITFTGILALGELAVDLALTLNGTGEWARISSGLAALGVGLPLWLSYWPALQAESGTRSERGDRARRSVIRRAYLYLAVFALVVGTMLAAGNLFFSLLSRLLGEQGGGDVLRTALQRLFELGAMAAFLIYHLRALRADGQIRVESLGRLHAAFPTLLLAEEDPALAEAIQAELTRQAPRLPARIHRLAEGLPEDDCLEARAVVLSAGLAFEPPEGLRRWLSACGARRIVLPLPPGANGKTALNWTWLGSQPRGANETAREAAAAVRQMAEGEQVRAGLPSSPWTIAGLALGGVFAFGLLISLFSLVINSLWR